MKWHEWMRYCIENRTSKKQQEIMFIKRINQQHERRLVQCFKEYENEWFIIVALDTTRRHTIQFCGDDYRGNPFWAEYSKKEKRFTHISYQDHGCYGHYIFLKHSPYLKP